jgi:hypothetical protein
MEQPLIYLTQMIIMKKYFLLPMLTLFVLLAISCNSTKITSSWEAPGAKQNNYKKILVMGILPEKDRSVRQQLERQLAEQLTGLGYTAVSAMDEFGPRAFEKIREEDIATRLKSSGYDAVLTTVLLDKSKERNYNPGSVSYQPIGLGVRYSRFGRYYTTIYDRVYQPGYYTLSTDYMLESNLYEIGSGDLKYSVQIKAFDPTSASSLGSDYGERIVKDMVKKDIIKKRNA